MATGRLGATRLSGLIGNVVLAKMSSGNTAYWIPDENTAITESQPTIGQTLLTPKTVACYTEISRQLMVQSTPTVDRIVGPEMLRRIAVEVDKAAIAGTGASGQPQGILQTNNVGVFTGSSLDLAALVNAQSDLAGANADPTRAGYATTPAVAAILMARPRFTSNDTPLWEGGIADGRVAGLPAIASTNMPSATMICAQWDQLILASWAGGVEIQVNPFADFATGKIAMRAMAMVDVAVAQPVAFTAASSIT
jgi:HK97 family phage major capsid protein